MGTKDPEWSAIGAWTIHTLVRADAQKAEWAGGIDSLLIDAAELGQQNDWQKQVGVRRGSEVIRNLSCEVASAPRGWRAPEGGARFPIELARTGSV
jgi:hypothetical protein